MSESFRLVDDLFELPSQGYAYDSEKIKLVNQTAVKIRPFVTADQRRLASVAGESGYKVNIHLWNHLVTQPSEKECNVFDLLTSDLIAALFCVKLRSFGSKFETSFKCSACSMVQNVVLNLTDLQVKYAATPEEVVADGLEYKAGDNTYTMHLPRISDSREVEFELKRLKAKGKIIDEQTDRFYLHTAQLIDAINGEHTPLERRFEHLMNQPLEVIDDIGEFLSENDFGVDDRMPVVCKNKECRWENNARVAMDAHFFRPTSLRGSN